MFQTLAKYKDDTEWKPVTWGGVNFLSNREYLEQLVATMRQAFPLIEYKIVEA